jgi:hypothetical protein
MWRFLLFFSNAAFPCSKRAANVLVRLVLDAAGTEHAAFHVGDRIPAVPVRLHRAVVKPINPTDVALPIPLRCTTSLFNNGIIKQVTMQYEVNGSTNGLLVIV